MELFVFAQEVGPRRVLTADRDGRNLPGDQPWLFLKTISVSRDGGGLIGADEDLILDAVEHDGYFNWPEKDV